MRRCLLLAITTVVAAGGAPAQPKTAAQITVIDAKGKEIEPRSWKFTHGTVRLWAKDDAAAAKNKAPGPECLAFREEKSTTYQNGIVTLVPLASIRAIDYDNDKKTVAVTLLNADGNAQTLRGSTKFKDINKLTLEAEADLGALGVATVRFHGGALADGIRGLRFAKTEPLPAPPAGRSATILAVDKEKHSVGDPVPVYRLGDGTLRTAPPLFFQATVKIDLAKIARLKHVERNDFKVTLVDGAEHSLTLLSKVDLEPGKTANLVGLAGRVSAGYKLFPPHTIAEAHFQAAAKPE